MPKRTRKAAKGARSSKAPRELRTRREAPSPYPKDGLGTHALPPEEPEDEVMDVAEFAETTRYGCKVSKGLEEETDSLPRVEEIPEGLPEPEEE